MTVYVVLHHDGTEDFYREFQYACGSRLSAEGARHFLVEQLGYRFSDRTVEGFVKELGNYPIEEHLAF